MQFRPIDVSDRLADSLARECHLRRVYVDEHDGELFTAKAGHHVVFTRGLSQDATHAAQYFVACRVQEAIVYLLEVVDVKQS